jgi:hypothetical protein
MYVFFHKILPFNCCVLSVHKRIGLPAYNSSFQKIQKVVQIVKHAINSLSRFAVAHVRQKSKSVLLMILFGYAANELTASI